MGGERLEEDGLEEDGLAGAAKTMVTKSTMSLIYRPWLIGKVSPDSKGNSTGV